MPTFGLEFLDIFTRIKDYANINNVTSVDTKAKRAANDALRLIASLRNWEALKKESSVTLTASVATYPILTDTTDFDHIISCWYLSNGQRIPIDVLDDEEWNKIVDEDTDGIPQSCRITKTDGTLSIQFADRPNSSFISQYTNIKFDYAKKPTELSGDTDIADIPDTSQQMAIVYYAVSDLLGKQGDLNGMAAWEAKGARILNAAHKIDDKKKGRNPRFGRPLIPSNSSRGVRSTDYR